MSLSYVTESRAYDSVLDATYTGPFSQGVSQDARVKMSSKAMVSGTARYKYFRRPVMPKLNAVPPQILLAPTAAADPMVPIEVVPEPLLKTVEVQTMYRESEAQTIPYTPNFTIADGMEPEILLLQGLTAENGLPLGKKEINMVQLARAKKILETNLPPFTDEASLTLRKRLMELQEMKEFKQREEEIDANREGRLASLQRVLEERDEAQEFLASQRVEAIRQTRMDEREQTLQKIRNKRIKVLRRLASRRNHAEPLLQENRGHGKDIIDEYFDKASEVYAPIKRKGKGLIHSTNEYDVASRTLPLNNLGNILQLETAVPEPLLDANHPLAQNFAPEKVRATMLSKTAPAGMKGIIPSGGRVTEDRLTSAARRDLRNTKRDIEEMHQILLRKKKEAQAAAALTASNNKTRPLSATDPNAAAADPSASASGPPSPTNTTTLGAAGMTRAQVLAAQRRAKSGRPASPDLTRDPNSGELLTDDSQLEQALVLLQRLVRGRAVQNVMFEGRYRRRELIAELRRADETLSEMAQRPADSTEIAELHKQRRDKAIKATTIEAVAGGATTNIIALLAFEQVSASLLVILIT